CSVPRRAAPLTRKTAPFPGANRRYRHFLSSPHPPFADDRRCPFSGPVSRALRSLPPGEAPMFAKLGRLVTSHPWLVCAAWVVVGAALTLIAPRWDARAVDDDITFLPARCDSVRGYQLLRQAFPQDVFASRALLTVERADRPLDAADLALVDRAVA